MERQLEICIDRTVESMQNPIQVLQGMGRKEFQTNTTRLKNAYTKVIDNAREVIHSEEKGILISNQVSLEEYINQCIKDGEYVLDIETTGLDPFNDLIVGICLYSPSQEPAYIPMLHTNIDNTLMEGQLEVAVVKQHITRLI